MAKRPTAFKSLLGSQLGSIVSRTWQQLEGVREVVVQKTKEGRLQIDLTLLRRKRKDSLAALGEVVARLARSGRLDEDDFPELSGPLSTVQDLEERIEREEHRARNVAAGLGDDQYDEGNREEYDEDDGSHADSPGRGRSEFDEDGERAAAGRRLRGEADYDPVDNDDSDALAASDEDYDDDSDYDDDEDEESDAEPAPASPGRRR